MMMIKEATWWVFAYIINLSRSMKDFFSVRSDRVRRSKTTLQIHGDQKHLRGNTVMYNVYKKHFTDVFPGTSVP